MAAAPASFSIDAYCLRYWKSFRTALPRTRAWIFTAAAVCFFSSRRFRSMALARIIRTRAWSLTAAAFSIRFCSLTLFVFSRTCAPRTCAWMTLAALYSASSRAKSMDSLIRPGTASSRACCSRAIFSGFSCSMKSPTTFSSTSVSTPARAWLPCSASDASSFRTAAYCWTMTRSWNCMMKSSRSVRFHSHGTSAWSASRASRTSSSTTSSRLASAWTTRMAAK